MPWNRVTVRRSELTRVGATFGKNLSTVRGIRWMVQATEGGANSEVRFEDTRISGGVNRPIFGEVQYCYVYVRNDGAYLAKSQPSAASSKYTLTANAATVQVPADASRDSQVNEVWLYRRGGTLPDWYRVKQETGVSGTGAISITDDLSDVDALTVGLILEDDNSVPPNDIIGIDGPYYDRTYYLTTTYLYPSRRLNPDSCSAGQVIRVAGADEVALWVKKTIGGLYIGTTKDIYRLSGDGAEYPDGSINFTLQNLNIDNPPRSSAVAQEGNMLLYVAADGWRAIQGAGSELLTGDTSLLYRGYTRHGIAPVNVGEGRFRAAVAQGKLSAITPEGTSTTSSTKLYRRRLGSPHWERHFYPNAFRSIYREPDGTLIAGDVAGYVWILDTGDDDGGSLIPIDFWTRSDDFGAPFARKDPHDFRVMIDTGGAGATVNLHINNGGSGGALAPATLALSESVFSLTSIAAFKQLQIRVSGLFSTFRWANLKLGYHQLPEVMRGHTPAFNFGKPGLKTMSGLQLRVCTLNAVRTFTPLLDGIPYASFTVQSAADEPVNHTHPFSFALTAKEIQLLIDGDVEMYEWTPLVTAVRPLGIKAWDSGPLDLGTGEFIWPREVWLKVQATADLKIQAYFDGVAYPRVTATIGPGERGTAAKIRVPIPRNYKGRIPKFVITSTEPFYPYWFEFTRRETGAAIEKPAIRVPLSLGGEVSA